MKSYQKQIVSVIFFVILLATTLIPMVNVPIQAEVQIRPSSTRAETQYWALLVGIGQYADNPDQNRPDMILEINDFKNLLLQTSWWSADHIKVLTAENATIRNILAGLRWLRKVARSNDIVVVYLSTHGFPLGIDIPPRDEANGSDTALVTYWGFAYKSLFIYDDEINVLLNQIHCTGVCLLVDSCYAGGFQDHSKILKNAAPQKRVILMGSCEDELSYSGGFAPYVIDGLRGYADSNGDGIVTAQEAFYYAKPRSIPRQHPTMYDNYPEGLPLTKSSLPEVSPSAGVPPRVGDTLVSPVNTLPTLADTSAICGYITASGQPIGGAAVSVYGRVNHSQYYQNQTTTNQNGFYYMHVPAIRLRVRASAQGYCDGSAGPYQISQNRTYWVNLSLVPRPTETATICGYVTSIHNATPLVANATVQWVGGQNQTYQNQTSSNLQGFYRMSVAPGRISLSVSKVGYFTEMSDDVTITGSQILWMNVSLYPMPAETATVCGYITDKVTGGPLPNIHLVASWVNISMNHSYMRQAQTNASGFFTMPIAPGELYIDLRTDNYYYNNPYRHDATAGTRLWMNLSLQKQTISVDIAKPLNALYVHDTRIIPIPKALIFGSITISAYVSRSFFEPGYAEKVEFYIDDKLKATVTTQPYNWTWSQKTLGKHLIKVVAYDLDGNSFTREIEVRKLL